MVGKTIKHFDQNGEKISLQNREDMGVKNEPIKKEVQCLFDAIKKNDVTMVGNLLKMGVDPNAKIHKNVDFLISSTNKSISYDRKIVLNEPTPLILALNSVQTNEGKHQRLDEQKKIIDVLLSYGASVNLTDRTNGISPIMVAVNYNDVDSTKKLIEKGADVNNIATLNCKYHPCEDRGIVTPLLLAINTKDKSNSSKCVDLLFDAGARIELNKSMPMDVVTIINGLSWMKPEKAHKVLKDIMKEDTTKLNYDNVLSLIDEFLDGGLKERKNIDGFVCELLGSSYRVKSSMGTGKYLAHLNSWNGLLSYTKGEENFFDSASGWQVYSQIPRKIRNMILALVKLEKEKFDFNEVFGEDKKNVLSKLKDEIYNQVTNYYTAYNMFVLNRAFVSRISIYEREEQRESKLPYSKKLEPYINTQAIKWAECISRLKKGKSFSFSAGSSNHAIYIEFKRQEDGNFSRAIYNLGAGKKFHSVTLDNLYYPSVVTDIPKEIIDKNNPKLLEYFYDIILSKANIWGEKHFSLYENAKLGGVPMKNVSGLVPMKNQVTGNCSVKNNLAGMKNRLNNKKLYDFLKNFEINILRKEIYIPKELYNYKELEKDVATINKIAKKRISHGQCIEKELFRFLNKRCKHLPLDQSEKKGFRIQKAIENMEKQTLKKYVESTPNFLRLVDIVATTFDLKELHGIVKRLKIKNNKNKIDLEELKKDLNGKDMKNLNKQKDIVDLEEDLFNVLKKRFKGDIRRVGRKKGVRINRLIKNIPEKVMDFYIKSNPTLLRTLRKVAREYKTSNLDHFVERYNEKYSIKKLHEEKRGKEVEVF